MSRTLPIYLLAVQLATCSQSPGSSPQEGHGAQEDAAHPEHPQDPASHVQRPKNHLANETSPYLLQHVHNPVDWHPWGPEAIERAKTEDRPIFLSVGYAACHWCHVMERESFENAEIAALMNDWFVCIKVDREERPDIDAIYMAAVQRMTGSGGWPMSVFMTPDLEPFIGGTYFPPKSKYGRPGFDDVLKYAHDLWQNDRDRVLQAGNQMMSYLRQQAEADNSGQVPGRDVLATGVTASAQGFDGLHGGFGRGPEFQPKFPHCTQIAFLLRYGAREKDAQALSMAVKTLTEMAEGGIYDQIAGGFARYSVDREWTVPHFEKMLYDNSQLALVYLEASLAGDWPDFARVSREILDYVLREMTSSEGGFYSTTDADSEGEEGKFFVWSVEELREVCGDDAPVALLWYGATDQGNFEGHNILTARTSDVSVAERLGLEVEEVHAAIERCRARLYERREGRIHPLLDDKVLSSWNGLMLTAFARAAVHLDEPRYLAAAQKSAAFLLGIMRLEDGSLYRTRRGDHSHLDAYLEDYAFVTQALLDLYEADLDLRWLRAAIELQDYTDEHFTDPKGGYFKTADNTEALPVRFNDAQESSLPSEIAVALLNGARIGMLQGDLGRVARARAGLAAHSQPLRRYPPAFGQLLLLTDFLTSSPPEVFVVGERDDPRVQAELGRLQRQWPPARVFALVEPGATEELEALLPAVAGKTLREGQPAVYQCYEGVCEAPRILE
jgi:uncharacterized protein YyaL (SSP411 family)